MSEWEITDPGEIALEGPVESIDAHLVRGALSVAVTEGPPRIVVGDVRGAPLIVRQVGGMVTVTHPALSSRSGLLDTMFESLSGLLGGRSTVRSAEVAILVPAPVRAAAKTTSAEVLFSGVIDSSVETVSGAITVSAAQRSLRLTSVSGDIAGAGVHGRLWLKTVSGEVTIVGATLTELSAHTVSGDVVIDADLEEGTHTFRGVSGGLALRVDPGAGIDLDASTVSGTLSCAVGERTEVTRPGGHRLHVDV
ncbi:MAG: DUF4097 family beta strand repeat-containing protein, partial [Acidimicrobiales bacterium]